MNSAMQTAFDTAAGFNASYVATGIVLVVAGVAYVWGANAVRALLAAVMHNPAEVPKGTKYVIRVVVLLMVLTYLLS